MEKSIPGIPCSTATEDPDGAGAAGAAMGGGAASAVDEGDGRFLLQPVARAIPDNVAARVIRRGPKALKFLTAHLGLVK